MLVSKLTALAVLLTYCGTLQDFASPDAGERVLILETSLAGGSLLGEGPLPVFAAQNVIGVQPFMWESGSLVIGGLFTTAVNVELNCLVGFKDGSGQAVWWGGIYGKKGAVRHTIEGKNITVGLEINDTSILLRYDDGERSIETEIAKWLPQVCAFRESLRSNHHAVHVVLSADVLS